MSKVEIVSELGDGQYMVKPIYDIARAELRLEELTALLIKLAAEINTLYLDTQVPLEIKRTDAINSLNVEINNLNTAAGNEELQAQYTKIIKKYTKEIHTINADLLASSLKMDQLKYSQATATIQKNLLDSKLPEYIDPPPAPVWCADYTTGLSGEVGSIELNDEVNILNKLPQIIMPSGDVGYGKLQPIISSESSAIIYNTTVLPAVQKWRPRYAEATISSIDVELNTCSIAMVNKFSSIYGFDGTKYKIHKDNFDDVPVDYMVCNALAFDEGDQVLVYYAEDPETPTVIGFISNPKICGLKKSNWSSAVVAQNCIRTQTQTVVTTTVDGEDCDLHESYVVSVVAVGNDTSSSQQHYAENPLSIDWEGGYSMDSYYVFNGGTLDRDIQRAGAVDTTSLHYSWDHVLNGVSKLYYKADIEVIGATNLQQFYTYSLYYSWFCMEVGSYEYTVVEVTLISAGEDINGDYAVREVHTLHTKESKDSEEVITVITDQVSNTGTATVRTMLSDMNLYSLESYCGYEPVNNVSSMVQFEGKSALWVTFDLADSYCS